MAFEDGAGAHSEKVMVGAGLAGPKTFILGLTEAESVFMVEIQRIERKITHVKKFCFFHASNHRLTASRCWEMLW